MRQLRVWLSNQATLAALLADIETERDRLAVALRRSEARRVAEHVDHTAVVAGLRREAASLDAANTAVIAQNRRERMFGNQLAHRNRKARDWADVNLPAGQAAELAAVLAPTMPHIEEPARAAVV